MELGKEFNQINISNFESANKQPNSKCIRKQKQLYQKGDIIVKPSNGFRRRIRHAEYQERSGIFKVMYSYYNEELDNYRATGNFDPLRVGYCSQDHLLRWREQ